MNKRAYLLVCDFDQTLAETFTPPPGGMDTIQAYVVAVEKVFGEKGLQIYFEKGGLRNRSPGEVVNEIIQEDVTLVSHAYNVYRDVFEANGSVRWNFMNPFPTISEMLVQFKLQCLSDQISTEWPKPYPGVIEFINLFKLMRHHDEILIDFAILSSGHENFINKTLALWKLPKPKVMVTDDDIRHRQKPSLEARTKPAPFPMRLLQLKLLQSESTNGFEREMIYFGDDPHKDGGLAKNVGVPFGWFNPHEKKHDTIFPEGSFSFQNWEKLNIFLGKIETRTQLFSGAPLSEVFSTF